jgi:flagellar protein FliO/FliZ
MENFTGQLTNTLTALSFVGVLAWVSLSLLKRWQNGRTGIKGGAQRNDLRFIRALPVGAKEKIVVIQYQNEEWLLGVTVGAISLLARHPLTPTNGEKSLDRPGLVASMNAHPLCAPLPLREGETGAR